MATRVSAKTTFDALRVIEPIYTGGEVSADANGLLIATSVEDDILIVEVKSGKPLLRIAGDGESVTSLSLSPSASHLVTCSRSLSMRIYALSSAPDTFHAQLLRTLKPHTTPVICSTIDATGSILVTGGADGSAKVWDIRGGYCSHTFHGHGGLVTALEIFESSQEWLRTNESASRKRKIHGALAAPDASVSVDSGTLLLATGGEDGKIKVWDLNSRENLATLDSHVSVIRSIRFSRQQESLMSASRDKTVVIWDIRDWTPRRTIPCLESIECGGFISNSLYCFTGGENGRLRVWNSQTGQETTNEQQSGLENEAIVTIVDNAATEALLCVHQDQTMTLQSYRGLQQLPSGKKIPSLPILRRISGNHDEIIDMVCVGSDRSKLALATNTETIKIISITEPENNLAEANFGADIALLQGHQDIIICLDIDWSGHWLATGAKDNTARLWRLDHESESYGCFAVFEGHAESLGAICLPKSPPQNSNALGKPLDHPPAYLITGSQDKTVKRWDTAKLPPLKTGDKPHTVAKAAYTRVAHEKDINALDSSSIAPLFASASQDRTIKVWSVEDGSIVAILRGHKRGVWSVKFSPAGTPSINLAEGGSSGNRGLLLSGSGDRSVKIWSLTTFTCLQTFEGHSNSVLKVLWLPQSSVEDDSEESNGETPNRNQPMIASASADTLVKIWTPYAPADSDHLLATLDNHSDRVWSLATAINSDSHHKPLTESKKSRASKTTRKLPPPYTFISGAADATLTFWKDTTQSTAAAASRHMTEKIEQDQLLQNHIHARNYRESITLALTLNHPGRLLKILEDAINQPESQKADETSVTGIKAVDEVLSTLSMTELYRLLERIRDWNTNARTAPVAQRVLNILLRSYPADTWTTMAKNQRQIAYNLRKGNVNDRTDGQSIEPGSVAKFSAAQQYTGGKMTSIEEIFRALEVYTERHYKRMEELIDESYLVEYTLREMDELIGGDVDLNGGSDDSAEDIDVDGKQSSEKNLEGLKKSLANGRARNKRVNEEDVIML